MKKNQEQWIDEVMGSLQGMQPAEGNPYLHTRILAHLQNPAREPVQVKWVYTVATAFVLMLLVNVMGWNMSFKSDDQETVDIETVINEYELENNYTSLP
jgi:type VI protein secretion system component VasF